MPAKIELKKGDRFGRLTLIRPTEKRNGSGNIIWLCTCDCDGKEVEVSSGNLRQGFVKSCGCLLHKQQYHDVTGQKFGKLTAIKYSHKRKNTIYWEFECSCEEHTRVIRAITDVKRSNKQSCGCADRKDYTGLTINGWYIIRYIKEKNGWLCVNNYNEEKIIESCSFADKRWNGLRNINKKFVSEYEELKEEWDYDKNVGIDINRITHGSMKKVWWKCKKCNNEWKSSINSRAKGCGCPKCKSSWGEKKIDKILSKNNILFETEKTYDDCRDINKLKFDFYLPDYNILIEYDGRQHYANGGYWKVGDDDLEKIQKRDKIKNKYCQDNNIKLIRIPYWDYSNIEEILIRELKLCKN